MLLGYGCHGNCYQDLAIQLLFDTMVMRTVTKILFYNCCLDTVAMATLSKILLYNCCLDTVTMTTVSRIHLLKMVVTMVCKDQSFVLTFTFLVVYAVYL